MGNEETRPKGFGETAIASFGTFGIGRDLIWKRGVDNVLRTNVYWGVRHHSPDGFEVGYSGSGPADLALNAMAWLFPILDEEEVENCFDGQVSNKAWRLHQKFKGRFLGAASRDEGRIAWEEIADWLREQGEEFQYHV